MSISGTAILSALITAVVGMLVMECYQTTPWLANKLMQWSVRLRYADNPQRAKVRGEELTSLLEELPTLFKFPTAGWFFIRALAYRLGPYTSEEPMENLGLLSWLLGQPLARRRRRQLARLNQERKQRLAWLVEEILAGRGIVGGRGYYVPQVVSVLDGPPVALDIRALPGQTPDDFVKHAPAIAYNFGMDEVRVVPLEPSLIRLELLPRA